MCPRAPRCIRRFNDKFLPVYASLITSLGLQRLEMSSNGTGVQESVDASATNEGGSKMMHATHLVIGNGAEMVRQR